MMQVSYVEIYLERVRDLLDPKKYVFVFSPPPLDARSLIQLTHSGPGAHAHARTHACTVQVAP